MSNVKNQFNMQNATIGNLVPGDNARVTAHVYSSGAASPAPPAPAVPVRYAPLPLPAPQQHLPQQAPQLIPAQPLPQMMQQQPAPHTMPLHPYAPQRHTDPRPRENPGPKLSVMIAGVLSLICALAGIYALIRGSSEALELDFHGVRVGTRSVGFGLLALAVASFGVAGAALEGRGRSR